MGKLSSREIQYLLSTSQLKGEPEHEPYSLNPEPTPLATILLPLEDSPQTPLFWFPSYLSGLFFLIQFFRVFLCMLSTPTCWGSSWLSLWSTSLLQLCFYPKLSRPKSQLLDGAQTPASIYNFRPNFSTSLNLYIQLSSPFRYHKGYWTNCSIIIMCLLNNLFYI